MSSQPIETPRTHPLHRFAGRLLAALDELGDPATWALTAAEKVETLTDLSVGIDRLHALQLALVADLDRTDAATEVGHVSTKTLVKAATRDTPGGAHRSLRLAVTLERHPATRAALLSGRLTRDQARAITTALDALPDTVSEVDQRRAEAHLLTEATHHDAQALARLGRHLVDVIDPDHADLRLAVALEREEARAAKRTYFQLYDNHDGTSDGRFRIPTRHAALLEHALGELLNPARHDPIDLDQPRDQARGEAFCLLLEHKVKTNVLVTLPLATLLGGLQAAHVTGGHLLSPGEARRLACRHGVIPMVLGTDSEVLDLGRRARLHTGRQRLAMRVQQHDTCAVEDCTRPAATADAHHLNPWTHGGNTTVHDGVLLCQRHHTLAHHSRHQLEKIRPGKVRLVRRQ